MKQLILVLLLCASGMGVRAQERDSLLVMFWNVENFFDWTDQGNCDSDKDFSSNGQRCWTRKRFYKKCDAISKSIMWIGDRYGCLPDVIGLAEVENREVLTRMLSYTLLRKYDYEIVHKESQDRRGIDVAFLYRKSSMTLVSESFMSPIYEGKPMNTRDILHVKMKLNNGDILNFTVNHHPSKFGGEKLSEDRRYAVMNALRGVCDSIGREPMVAMGDFNDTPDGRQFDLVNDILLNKGIKPHQEDKGTIRYKGKWELIDFFMVSPDIECSEMEILEIPFLTTYDTRYPGEKPLRTYSGPRYLGGVSDHYPILLKVY